MSLSWNRRAFFQIIERRLDTNNGENHSLSHIQVPNSYVRKQLLSQGFLSKESKPGCIVLDGQDPQFKFLAIVA